MSDRITKADVRNAFGWMHSAAALAGLDTEGWYLEPGSYTNGISFRLYLGKYAGREFAGHIGKTAREAYRELRVMEHAFNMISGQAAGPPPAWWGRNLP